MNNFLEYGEHNANLYGTHIDSIKDVIKSGKMCVLDVAPNALKMLHNSQELMPFVIFIAAPGMDQLKQIYAERRATGSNRNLSVSSLLHSLVTISNVVLSVRQAKLNSLQFSQSQDLGISRFALRR